MFFNKNTLMAILIAFGIQVVLGINYASAICQNELENYCSSIERHKTLHKDWLTRPPYSECVGSRHNEFIEALKKELASPKDFEGMLNYHQSEVSRTADYRELDDNPYALESKYALCMYKNAKAENLSEISSNKSSSSGSSRQANKKASRQATASQSSYSDDERVKKLNEAVDQGNSAHDNKDYVKSIAAIKFILANSSNITLKGEATNRLAEYYKYGHGVQKDEAKAQTLFEQASANGNADANAHICQNYQDGTGGVTKNHQTAIKYCTEAANKGHVDAMSKLGYLYHAGIGTINPQLGNELICKAAKQGDRTAIGNAEKLKLNCE